SLSPSGSSACQEIWSCCPAGRESVCACVPTALLASPVSVTVIEKADEVLELALFAALAEAACAETVMLRIDGAVFCGRYAMVTLSSSAVPVKSARHWMKRALGLAIKDFAGSVMDSDQSLQVLSGRAEFPARVLNATPLLPTHDKRPQ